MLSWCWCCRPATLRNCSRHSVFGSSVVGLSYSPLEPANLPVTVCLPRSVCFRWVLQSSFLPDLKLLLLRLLAQIPNLTHPPSKSGQSFFYILLFFTIFFFSLAWVGSGVSRCGSFYEYEWLSTRLLSHQLRWLVAFQFLVVAFCSFTCRSLLAWAPLVLIVLFPTLGFFHISVFFCELLSTWRSVGLRLSVVLNQVSPQLNDGAQFLFFSASILEILLS